MAATVVQHPCHLPTPADLQISPEDDSEAEVTASEAEDRVGKPPHCGLCGHEDGICTYVVDDVALPLTAVKAIPMPSGEATHGMDTTNDQASSSVGESASTTPTSGLTWRQISQGGKLLLEYADHHKFENLVAFLPEWRFRNRDVEMVDVNEVEDASVLQIVARSPTTATTADFNMDDAQLTAVGAGGFVRSDGPPLAKRPKTAQQYWKCRTPIFPVENTKPCKNGGINALPAELKGYIIQDLLPPTLVALAQTCSEWYKYLSDPAINHSVWGRARVRYGMLGPNSAIDSGSGVSRTELSWAMWMFGGGKCQFCDRWTYTPPASFALNIHVCLMQECRSHWRKQCKQCVIAMKNANNSDYIQVNPRPPKNLSTVASTSVPPPQPAQEVVSTELNADETLEGHPDYEGQDEEHELLPAIAKDKFLCMLLLNHPSLRTALAKTPQVEQPKRLQEILESPAQRRRLGMDKDERVDEALPVAVAMHNARKKKRDKKKKHLPEFLGELQSVQWPHGDPTLRQLVKAGLPFVECGPKHIHNKTEWGLPLHVRRKYKLTDLHRALEEWNESALNGSRAELIEEWHCRAAVLEDKIIVAQKLMRWRDQRKKVLDEIRMNNDRFLRDVSQTEGLEWHDASNAPTLVQMRHFCELNYEQIAKRSMEQVLEHDGTPRVLRGKPVMAEVESDQLTGRWENMTDHWSLYRQPIIAESKLLNGRRTNREFQNKKHGFRDLRISFHQYCTRNAAHLNVSVIPPFALFEKLNSVTSVVPVAPPVVVPVTAGSAGAASTLASQAGSTSAVSAQVTTSPAATTSAATAPAAIALAATAPAAIALAAAGAAATVPATTIPIATTAATPTAPSEPTPEVRVSIKRWHLWEGHVQKDLQAWEKTVKHLLATIAGICVQDLDHPTCLFRCETCDAAANKHLTNTLTQSTSAIKANNEAKKAQKFDEVKIESKKSRRRSGKSAHAPTPMPRYHAPLTWKEIATHDCAGSWDITKFQKDAPAARLAQRAIKVLHVGNTDVTITDLKALGKAWKCTACPLPLSWDELYMHSLRHVWQEKQGKSPHQLPSQVFPNGIWCSVGPEDLKHPLSGAVDRGGDDRMDMGDDVDEAFGRTIVRHNPPLSPTLPMNANLSVAPTIGQALPPDFCKAMIHAEPWVRKATMSTCAHCFAVNGSMTKQLAWDGLRDHMNQMHSLSYISNPDVILRTPLADLLKNLAKQKNTTNAGN